MPEFHSKWRDRFQNHVSSEPPKPTEAPFGSFVSGPSNRPAENEASLRELWGERFTILATPPEALALIGERPRAAFIRLDNGSVLLVDDIAKVLSSRAAVVVLWQGGKS